jgi:hypothetical protein
VATGRDTTCRRQAVPIPFLNKDFETRYRHATISSPPLTNLEIQLRAKGIRNSILAQGSRRRTQCRPAVDGVLVYPDTIAAHVLRSAARWPSI